MSESTFLTKQVGDVIYYSIIENTVVKTKSEIKTAVISDIQKDDNYNMTITLNNGHVFTSNWNQEVCVVETEVKNADTYAVDSVKALNCNVYATEPKLLKNAVGGIVENLIGKYALLSTSAQSELCKLAGARIMYQAMMLKKIEKLVLEPVIV